MLVHACLVQFLKESISCHGGSMTVAVIVQCSLLLHKLEELFPLHCMSSDNHQANSLEKFLQDYQFIIRMICP